ncbi:MAG: DUF58 domain-containing protein, partial [Lachnospiraceae bacterium]|nr:DUF58 domain-containing protein [Lachnospiraceae bacterium]
MKKNIVYIVTYILAVLVVLLGALFYRQPVLTALLLLMFMLPVLSILMCSVAKEKLKIGFIPVPLGVTAGNEMTIRLEIVNESVIPLLNCMLTFSYQNRFFPNRGKNELIFAAPPKSRKVIDLNFDAPVPGLFELETEMIAITDLLHMKTWKIPCVKTVKTSILPEETEVDISNIRKATLEEEAENSYTGEPSREVRQIREYVPGDKLRDMHWKQTARLDEPMVREFERTRESFYVLCPVIEPARELKSTMSVWYSLALKLIKQVETVFTVIPDENGQMYSLVRSGSEEELLETVYELYSGTGIVTEEMIARIHEEIGNVAVIRDGKIAEAGAGK